MFYNMKAKVFKKKGYKFNRIISTDGVGCTILFVRNNMYNPLEKTMVKKMKKRKCLLKTLVGGDPGKDKPIQCSDGKVEIVKKENGKVFRKTNTYKYTYNLRIETTKLNGYHIIEGSSYHNIIIRDMELPFDEGHVERIVTVSEIELLLERIVPVVYGKKHCYILYYVQYHYNEYIYRKLKWYGFKNKFGGPEKSYEI